MGRSSCGICSFSLALDRGIDKGSVTEKLLSVILFPSWFLLDCDFEGRFLVFPGFSLS